MKGRCHGSCAVLHIAGASWSRHPGSRQLCSTDLGDRHSVTSPILVESASQRTRPRSDTPSYRESTSRNRKSMFTSIGLIKFRGAKKTSKRGSTRSRRDHLLWFCVVMQLFHLYKQREKDKELAPFWAERLRLMAAVNAGRQRICA